MECEKCFSEKLGNQYGYKIKAFKNAKFNIYYLDETGTKLYIQLRFIETSPFKITNTFKQR